MYGNNNIRLLKLFIKKKDINIYIYFLTEIGRSIYFFYVEQ